MAKMNPMERLGTVEDIASAVAFRRPRRIRFSGCQDVWRIEERSQEKAE
jgi:hypothetical protein